MNAISMLLKHDEKQRIIDHLGWIYYDNQTELEKEFYTKSKFCSYEAKYVENQDKFLSPLEDTKKTLEIKLVFVFRKVVYNAVFIYDINALGEYEIKNSSLFGNKLR